MSSSADSDPYVRLLSELSERPPRRAMLVEIVDGLLRAVEGERGFLFLLRPSGGFHVIAARNQDCENVTSASRRMSHFAVSRMLASDEEWSVTDARMDRRFRTEDAAEGLRPPLSIHIFPARCGGELVGGVYVDHRFRELDRARTSSLDAKRWVGLCDIALRVREQERLRSSLEKKIPALRSQRTSPAKTSGSRRGVERRDLVSFHGFDSANPDVLDLFDTVLALGASDIPVIVSGETGTGKGTFVDALHRCSGRADGPLITLSCAAVPESLFDSELLGHVRGAFTGAADDRAGLLEQADGGTFVLDEIGDMSLETQTKLLRVLEDGRVRPLGGKEVLEVDVRVVSVTSRDLESLVQSGVFRRDLFYRLCGAALEMPPLRDRWEDVPGLAEIFLRRHARRGKECRLSGAVLERLAGYSWPGNVRELENEMRRLAVLGVELVELEHLSAPFKGRRRARDGLSTTQLEPLDEVVATAEREAIEAALSVCEGNKSLTAKRLGITRKALYRRLAKYGLGGGTPDGESADSGEDIVNFSHEEE